MGFIVVDEQSPTCAAPFLTCPQAPPLPSKVPVHKHYHSPRISFVLYALSKHFPLHLSHYHFYHFCTGRLLEYTTLRNVCKCAYPPVHRRRRSSRSRSRRRRQVRTTHANLKCADFFSDQLVVVHN